MMRLIKDWVDRSLPVALCVATACYLLPATVAGDETIPETIEFNRDVWPILSDACFQCHGPDEANREADLRFDTKDGAFADLGGYRVILPGNRDESELFKRLTTDDDDERMPPADADRKLTPQQIELIGRWIEQGAKWQQHWSFVVPERRAPPDVKTTGWVQNAVDTFVLAGLESRGLEPSVEADRSTLIRRVTLDLTGLPPTPAEVDAFLRDTSPAAYERVVDRLLMSPRYGERMATRWLDAARYADTNGYQTDGPRVMWRWRDWVIDAYNGNMPFDRFTIEQLAGDMLPGATLDQKIATGFNRNHRGNAEGGIIPEEFAVEYVVDRVDTTFTVWLGLSMMCARCHDHKYDPISRKEFYEVFAIFNNVPEKGKAFKLGNSVPFIKTPTDRQQAELAKLESKLKTAENRFAALEPELAAAQAGWESAHDSTQPIDWWYSDGLLARYRLDGDAADTSGAARKDDSTDGNSGESQSGESDSRHGKIHGGEPAYASGRLGQAAELDGQRFIEAGDVGDFGFYDKFSCGAWIYLDSDQGGAILSRMSDDSDSDGYSLEIAGGKVHVHLIKRWLDDGLRVETVGSLAPGQWHHVMMTYDGSRMASGVQVYVDGEPQELKANLDDLNQSFKTAEPLRIGSRGTRSRFRGLIDDVRVYNKRLSAGEVQLIATSQPIPEIAATPAAKRGPAQANKLRAFYLERHAPEPIQQANARLVALRKEREHMVEGFPTTMVMVEMKEPRETFMLTRGEYDKPGDRVSPGVPEGLSRFPEGAPRNRIGFAQWLVSPSHPLTARVAVNRYWQMYFGAGLVKSVEDFGSQGQRPTHPRLLDWLATEFIRTGWDVKAIQKSIVMSATYRQSSKVTPRLLETDPENRLLARGPRFRLPAQMVRDQALAIGGLLVEKIGGPSVKPYQPEGLWKEISGLVYEQDHGESLYRRSMYTFFKRTAAPPSMMTFDAAGREACIVRATRTNTPLQALTLMNDVTFVEPSRVLAQRMITEGGATPEERIRFAFRLAAARSPRPAELEILLGGLDHHLVQYRADSEAARKLLSVGEYPLDENLDASQLAAYTTIASLIMNLDEVVTKE